jgi:hypothetical protein
VAILIDAGSLLETLAGAEFVLEKIRGEHPRPDEDVDRGLRL